MIPCHNVVHLEISGSGKIRCHGTGRHRITIHRPQERKKVVSVDLTAVTVQDIDPV